MLNQNFPDFLMASLTSLLSLTHEMSLLLILRYSRHRLKPLVCSETIYLPVPQGLTTLSLLKWVTIRYGRIDCISTNQWNIHGHGSQVVWALIEHWRGRGICRKMPWMPFDCRVAISIKTVTYEIGKIVAGRCLVIAFGDDGSVEDIPHDGCHYMGLRSAFANLRHGAKRCANCFFVKKAKKMSCLNKITTKRLADVALAISVAKGVPWHLQCQCQHDKCDKKMTLKILR